RSRNDQVALDLRLLCRAAAAALSASVAMLVEALARQALAHADWAMPGYTHLQRAQPVTAGHHLLAHAEPLLRDAVRLRHADEAATGSSIMPQKKNPDIAELIRGRSGRALGALLSLATVLKGLPLAYDRDLQEDKPAIFGAVENAAECLEAARLVVERLEFDRQRLEAALADPGLYATDTAEQMVAAGTAFREAHRTVGRQVAAGKHTPPWDAQE